MREFTCPVCQIGRLEDDPLDQTHEICGVCGVQFGYEDSNRTHEELRAGWLKAGSPSWAEERAHPDFKGGVKWLRDYFGVSEKDDPYKMLADHVREFLTTGDTEHWTRIFRDDLARIDEAK